MSDSTEHDRIEAAQRLGTVLEGRYRLVAVLGEGGMGAVYEAQHTVIDRRVAIKMLHRRYSGSDSATERFLREARAASAIAHPNVIDVLDVGRADDGAAYIVMERLRGASLGELLQRHAIPDTVAAIDLALGILAGLGAAHARGIVHRDLKPDNIFVVNEACTADAVRILDFGISKVTDRSDDAHTLTRTGAVLGTPFYMSPEQAAGERDLDARTDLWAVGVMLYEMLGGRLPFPGDSYNAVLARVLTRTPEPLAQLAPGLPAALYDAVDLALARERDARFPDAAAFANALLAVRSELGAAPLSLALTLDGDAPHPTPTPTPRPTPDTSSSGARRPSAETLLGETLDGPPAPTTTGERDTVAETPEPEHNPRPTLDVAEDVPAWKRVLWYALTLPLAWLPASIAMSGDRELLRDMLALPVETPAWTGVLVMLAWCAGLTTASVLVARFWQKGRWSRWLHGEGFVVFPLIGLGMTLFHYLRLSTQHESHMGSLRTYTAINRDQAEQLVGMLEASNERFIAAASTDQLLIGLLALIVLLGYVFVRPRGEPAPNAARRWLVLPLGVVVIALVEATGFYPELAAPPLRMPLYVTWLLTAIALLRLRSTRAKGFHQGWQTLRAGLIACVALTGLQIVGSVMFILERIRGQSLETLPSYEREQLFLAELLPGLVSVTWREWVVLVVLLAGVVALCSDALRWREGRKRDAARTVAFTVLIVAVTALPAWILMRATGAVSRQWLPLQIASMHPAALEPNGPLAFYLDRRPQTLHAGRKTLFGELTGEPRSLYEPERLLGVLAGYDDPAPCPEILRATLGETGDAVEALCISGIEAQRYCEGRGMRLPTPDEWRAALGALDPESTTGELHRSEHGEWTRHLVHDRETFVVEGRERDDEIPDLRADQTSPRVGFRCAFTFDD